MLCYKLLKRRKDGTLGSLFINARAVVPVGVWLDAEEHETPGFAFRPGWHCTMKQEAPHLKKQPKNGPSRVWCLVQVEDYETFDRPLCQGGTWILAQRMRIVRVLG